MTLIGAVQPAATSGIVTIATAVGGVAVSIFTVYKNAQKQAQYTGENSGHIQSLSEQIGTLNAQIIELKTQNSSLTTELRLLRESHEAAQRRSARDYDYDDDEIPIKQRRPRHEDEEDENYEPPRRKRTPEPPATRRKKK